VSPEAARRLNWLTYRDSCLLPALKRRLESAPPPLAPREARLLAQAGIVEACWWLKLCVSCGYVAEADAILFLGKNDGCFAFAGVRELADLLGESPLLAPLTDATKKRGLELVVNWNSEEKFMSPRYIRPNLQALLGLAGDFEADRAALMLLAKLAFADQRSWEACLAGTADSTKIARLLAEPEADPSREAPIDVAVAGFFQVMEHVAAVMALFEGLDRKEHDRDCDLLRNRVRTILNIRINCADGRFDQRIRSVKKIAGAVIGADAEKALPGMAGFPAKAEDLVREFEARVDALLEGISAPSPEMIPAEA
jgi:hypothetical protein